MAELKENLKNNQDFAKSVESLNFIGGEAYNLRVESFLSTVTPICPNLRELSVEKTSDVEITLFAVSRCELRILSLCRARQLMLGYSAPTSHAQSMSNGSNKHAFAPA